MGNIWVGEEKLNNLVKAFHMKGFEIYAVGGCVRDFLLHYHPKDIDFCTNATTKQMYEVARTLAQELHEECYIIPTGEEFGTLTFHFHEGGQYEVTSYRKDGAYRDGRHPDEVVFTTSIVEDLARRDFTCNAIAMNWETKELIDPFGGETDIQNGIIRCVGNPKERFEEDALRILRLARFAIKYNFKIEDSTLKAAYKTIDKVKMVSWERIGAELTKIFQFDLHKLTDKELKDFLILIVEISLGCRNTFLSSTATFFSYTTPLLRWRFASHFSTQNEQESMAFLNKMALGKEIVFGVRNVSRAVDFIYTRGSIKKRVLNIVRTEEERKALFDYLILDYDKDIIVDLVRAIIRKEPYCLADLAIDGDWVMRELGIEEGKKVAEILQKALNYVCLCPEMNTEKYLKEYLTEIMQEDEVDAEE